MSIVRETTSALTLSTLIRVLNNLEYFYGNAPLNNGDGVRISVIEETLTDGSKQIYYSIKK